MVALTELSKNLYIYADNYVKPFFDMHLILENYTDTVDPDCSEGYLLFDEYANIVSRLDTIESVELKKQLVLHKKSLDEKFAKELKNFLDNIPNWHIYEAYNTGGDVVAYLKRITDRECTNINYKKAIDYLRKLEEAYHLAVISKD